MLPPGHAEAARIRPKLAPRERRIVAAVAALALTLVIVTLISLGSSAPPHARGCVDATVPGFIGATEFHRCGAAARQLCTGLGAGDGLGRFGEQRLAAACRSDGLPVGGGPSKR